MMAELMIEGQRIADDSPMYVVAEVGHCHNGNVLLAHRLLEAAKVAGADAVKLQKRHPNEIYTSELYDRSLAHENAFATSYGAHRAALELSWEAFRDLQAHARKLALTLFATPFGLGEAGFLGRLDMPLYKIASGDLTNIPLLERVAGFGQPMFVSTGGANLDDVRRTYDLIMPINPQLALLQCTCAYPTRYADMNLRVIETYRREFPECVIGLSSHADTGRMATAAYMLGARVIEKHFTLAHDMKGTDHAFALDPQQFGQMTRDLRRLYVALGDGEKRILEIEAASVKLRAKSLVAARDLKCGHTIGREDVALKCPGGGPPPYELEGLIGRTLPRAIEKDECFPDRVAFVETLELAL